MTTADHGLPVSYSPGPHLLLVAPGCTLLLGADAEKAWGCWPLVRDGAEADDLLDAILLVGLRSIGSFGLVRSTARGMRVVVRGDIIVRAGDQVISAEPEQSWVDTTLPAGTALALGGDASGEMLPLVVGAARATSVLIGESSEGLAPPVALPSAYAADPGPIAAEPTPEADAVEPGDTTLDQPAAGEVTIEPSSEEDAGHTVGRTASYEYDSQSRSALTESTARPALIESMPFTVGVPGSFAAPPDAAALQAPSPSEVDDATIKRGSIGHELRPVDPASPLVLAVRCAAGHLSPGFVATCRVCGSLVDAQTPIEVMRPILGQLRLSTGDVVTLDRGAVMGRAPSVPSGTTVTPHLIKLGSSETDLSRSHLEVALDGWHVVVTDLGSKNGSVVTRPGSAPERLRAHESQIIEPGTVVSLADVISFRFEATS